MALYNEVLPVFGDHGAEIVGISVDGVWCHGAYAEHKNLHFPLLSDFEPKGEVSRRYGAYEHRGGFSKRALFVLDGDGVIRWSYESPIDVNPGADGILAALEAMPAASTV
jgi:peroxiredoxin